MVSRTTSLLDTLHTTKAVASYSTATEILYGSANQRSPWPSSRSLCPILVWLEAPLICDEASRIDDKLIGAVRPMLAVGGGRLVMLTTPAGKRGHFYESWVGDDPQWHRVKVNASDCPRISREFLDSELKALGTKMFESEYGLVFHDDDEAMFSDEMITRAFTPEVLPLWQ